MIWWMTFSSAIVSAFFLNGYKSGINIADEIANNPTIIRIGWLFSTSTFDWSRWVGFEYGREERSKADRFYFLVFSEYFRRFRIQKLNFTWSHRWYENTLTRSLKTTNSKALMSLLTVNFYNHESITIYLSIRNFIWIVCVRLFVFEYIGASSVLDNSCHGPSSNWMILTYLWVKFGWEYTVSFPYGWAVGCCMWSFCDMLCSANEHNRFKCLGSRNLSLGIFEMKVMKDCHISSHMPEELPLVFFLERLRITSPEQKTAVIKLIILKIFW